VALLVTFGVALTTAPAEARNLQDGRAARVAAAHALIDGELETAFDGEEMQRSVVVEGVTAQEQAAIVQAAAGFSPQMVRDTQNIVAEAMADALSLSQLQQPDTITEAEFEALSAATKPHLEALGARFAYDAISKGCRITDRPSEVCRKVLAMSRPPAP
jgi:hypothetical protein